MFIEMLLPMKTVPIFVFIAAIVPKKIKKDQNNLHYCLEDGNSITYFCDPASNQKDNCALYDSAKLLENDMLKSLVSDLGGKTFSYVDIRPNAKAHTNIVTKKHRKD